LKQVAVTIDKKNKQSLM